MSDSDDLHRQFQADQADAANDHATRDEQAWRNAMTEAHDNHLIRQAGLRRIEAQAVLLTILWMAVALATLLGAMGAVLWMLGLLR